LAGAIQAAGIGAGGKVGMYLYNSPEYCETNFAALKVRSMPINVNYRYLDNELLYLVDNADVGGRPSLLVPRWHGDDRADGALVLLGRGSNCINTGGEKVYPEEVEEAVKVHPAVEDALVFGVPDDRFGQRVVGIVSLTPGESASPDQIVPDARSRLSSHAPQQHNAGQGGVQPLHRRWAGRNRGRRHPSGIGMPDPGLWAVE
jgi:acyl-CoA synthetase (AMP-forming)/AMP-acid ligase II